MAARLSTVAPNLAMSQTVLLDATPRVVRVLLADDRQSLLTLLRYNRVIEAFTGIPCFSVGTGLETKVRGLGKVVTDELYIGMNGRGERRVFALQARGAQEALDPAQVERDFVACARRFPDARCFVMGAQLLDAESIAVIDFVRTSDGIRKSDEKHFQLVTGDHHVDEAELDYLRLLA